MGRFAEKYSREWKQLICDAVLQPDKRRRLTCVQAIEAARRCELPGQREPFDMTLGTARDEVRKEKRRRAGLDLTLKQQGTPEERLDALASRALAIIEHRHTRLEGKLKANQFGDKEAEHGRKLAAWAREVRMLVRGQPPTKGTGQGARKAPDQHKTQTEKQADQASDLVRQMVSDIRNQPPTNTHNGTGTTATPDPPAVPQPHQPQHRPKREEGRASS